MQRCHGSPRPSQPLACAMMPPTLQDVPCLTSGHGKFYPGVFQHGSSFFLSISCRDLSFHKWVTGTKRYNAKVSQVLREIMDAQQEASVYQVSGSRDLFRLDVGSTKRRKQAVSSYRRLCFPP